MSTWVSSKLSPWKRLRINEIFGDFEEEDQLEKKPALKKEEEEKKPSWFDKERKLSLISIPSFYSE